jgi:Flp pilus assembly protein TadG
MNTQHAFPVGRRCRSFCRRRRGVVLVWFALLVTVLLGMLGLVIDAGMLLAAHRQAHNMADAAALAAATDKMRGQSDATATATAVQYVRNYNTIGPTSFANTPDPVVNIPPAVSLHYAGDPNYVEVIASSTLNTFFIHLLPGVNRQQTIAARAVAGFELVSAGEGVAVLDPDARPGLRVDGGGRLVVRGLVVDNSEGGGVDEYGNPIDNGNNGYSASVGGTLNDPTTGIYAKDIRTVGGVDDPAFYQNIEPDGPSPLKTGQLPFPDPFINLPTPTEALGVDATPRGSPAATNQNLMLNDPSGLNYVETDSATGAETMVLHPGIYDEISITGGNVRFFPGIYVIAAKKSNQNVLKITGGNVTAQGVMFYNTGHTYSPSTGAPDRNDGSNPPPSNYKFEDGSTVGSIQINAGMQFSPLDTTNPDFPYGQYVNPVVGGEIGEGTPGPIPSSEFDGFLFYQRRRNAQPMEVSGNAADGLLEGTLYAKWSNASITGQGTYDAQFVVGSMKISGQGDITINFIGDGKGRAPQVFLVE